MTVQRLLAVVRAFMRAREGRRRRSEGSAACGAGARDPSALQLLNCARSRVRATGIDRSITLEQAPSEVTHAGNRAAANEQVEQAGLCAREKHSESFSCRTPRARAERPEGTSVSTRGNGQTAFGRLRAARGGRGELSGRCERSHPRVRGAGYARASTSPSSPQAKAPVLRESAGSLCRRIKAARQPREACRGCESRSRGGDLTQRGADTRRPSRAPSGAGGN